MHLGRSPLAIAAHGAPLESARLTIGNRGVVRPAKFKSRDSSDALQIACANVNPANKRAGLRNQSTRLAQETCSTSKSRAMIARLNPFSNLGQS
jgi:hypothetical protein